MLFFSQIIGAFDAGYSNLLGLHSKEDGEGDDTGGEEEAGHPAEADRMFLWLCLVKEFSDITKERWENVWTTDMPTFFNIISFSREFSKRQKEEIKKWQQQTLN